MNALSFVYDEKENGYKTDRFQITGDIFLRVNLAEKGRVVIKRYHPENDTNPKVYISPIEGPDIELKLYGFTKDSYLQIFTSTEPKDISYANI